MEDHPDAAPDNNIPTTPQERFEQLLSIQTEPHGDQYIRYLGCVAWTNTDTVRRREIVTEALEIYDTDEIARMEQYARVRAILDYIGDDQVTVHILVQRSGPEEPDPNVNASGDDASA